MNPSTASQSPSASWPSQERIKVGTFSIMDEHGHFLSRPMLNQQVDVNGSLWFFTSNDPHIANCIAARPGVNVRYAEPDEDLYVSATGRAEQVRDELRIAALWSPLMASWFPAGVNDPHLMLIRVRIESAEYWDLDPGKALQLYKLDKIPTALETYNAASGGTSSVSH